MLQDIDNCPSQFPRVQGDDFECLVLCDQQSKTLRYSVYSDRQILTMEKLDRDDTWYFLAD